MLPRQNKSYQGPTAKSVAQAAFSKAEQHLYQMKRKKNPRQDDLPRAHHRMEQAINNLKAVKAEDQPHG